MSIPEKDKWALDLDRIRGRPTFFAEREPTTGTNFGAQGPCDGLDRTPGDPYDTLYDDEIGIAVRLSIKVPSRVTVITVGIKNKGKLLFSNGRNGGELFSPKAQVTFFFFFFLFAAQQRCVCS